ncbi:hypothetical protein [Curtobacterium luteum]|uniref:hypothetical protein n=1 Tax=Curtobacterium luteum TaxID=33881 RepID=UPI0037F737C7
MSRGRRRQRDLRIVSLAVFFAVALKGCSQRAEQQPQAQAPTAEPTTSDRIPTVTTTEGLRQLRWTDTGRRRDGLPVLAVQNEDCVAPVGVTVRETSTSVTVTAWGRKQVQPCAAVGYALYGAVPLDEPLGHRTLHAG